MKKSILKSILILTLCMLIGACGRNHAYVVHYVDGSTDTIEARSARNINSKMVFTIDDTTRYIIPDKDSVKYLVIIKDTAN